MRRKDREVTGEAIREIIDSCRVARIAMIDGDKPYIVPMNFGYFMQENELTLFFHCAMEGKKLDVLRQNNRVFFEMDCEHELIEKTNPCSYSFAYASVMGDGVASFIENTQEKLAAFELLMLHQTGRAGFAFTQEDMNHVTIFKVVSTSFTAKRSKRPS